MNPRARNGVVLLGASAVASMFTPKGPQTVGGQIVRALPAVGAVTGLFWLATPGRWGESAGSHEGPLMTGITVGTPSEDLGAWFMNNNPRRGGRRRGRRPARFRRRGGRWPSWFGRPGGGFVPLWGAYGPYSQSVPGYDYIYSEPIPGSVAYMPTNLSPSGISPAESPSATGIETATKLVPESIDEAADRAAMAPVVAETGVVFKPATVGDLDAGTGHMDWTKIALIAGGALLLGWMLRG